MNAAALLRNVHTPSTEWCRTKNHLTKRRDVGGKSKWEAYNNKENKKTKRAEYGSLTSECYIPEHSINLGHEILANIL